MADKKSSNNTAAVNADKREAQNAKAPNSSTESNDSTSNISTSISYSSASHVSSSQAAKPSSTKKTDDLHTKDNVNKAPDNKQKTDVAPNKATKEPLTSATKTETKAVTKTPSSSSSKPTKNTHQTSGNKAAKTTAIIALIIAILSIAGSIGHYFWQQQQTNIQLSSISQSNEEAIKQSQIEQARILSTKFDRELARQSQVNNQSLNSALLAQNKYDKQLQLLAAQIKQLESQVTQQDPSDWLVHEAEYLVRIAARTMWLEHDTTAAINLLRDADSRLKELNHPKFLPVRALINQDIEHLAQMPVLSNEEAILTLMALNKQVVGLTLSGVNLAEVLNEEKTDFELSDDVNDWQDNLAKTWQKFKQEFITVRRRSGMVEPLMSTDQQQNLKQNISLKIQLAQWAASEKKSEVYQQTLLDIQAWLNEYFDMELAHNKRFYHAIDGLKSHTIYYNYPSDLASLTLLKRLLDETKNGKPAIPNKPVAIEKNNKSNTAIDAEVNVEASETQNGDTL